MSLSNFLNIGSYGNMFTSGCFGSCSYEDTMTGYQVANAAMGAVGSIFSAIMANKQSQPETPSTEDQIAKIDEQISQLNGIDPEDEISSKYDNDIKGAEQQKTDYEAKLNALDSEASDYNEKKKDYEAVLTTLNGPDTQEGSIAHYKKQKEDAIEAKRAEIKEQIDKLQKQKAALQEDANDQILDQADGANWKKTSQEDFDKKWNADGTPKKGEEFTKGDMRYAIAMFRNAQTETDKEKWANTIDTIYQDFMNNNMKNITSDFKAARKIVDEYVTKE